MASNQEEIFYNSAKMAKEIRTVFLNQQPKLFFLALELGLFLDCFYIAIR